MSYHKFLSLNQSNNPNPMSSSDPEPDSDSFFSSFFSSAGAAPPESPPDGAAAPPPPPAGADPTLQIKSPMLRPWRALANRPGQNASTLTLAALMILAIFSPVISMSSSYKISALYTQASSDTDTSDIFRV